MHLQLKTTMVWKIEQDFPAENFLQALPLLLEPGDIMGFGAYEPSPRLLKLMNGLDASESDEGRIYNSSFKYNREAHPQGRPFEVTYTPEHSAALVEQAKRTDGQNDKELFFEHFVAYRRGLPVVPLMDFHDAFSGGYLLISDLYPEDPVRAFAAAIGAKYTSVVDPALARELAEAEPDGRD